MLRGRHGRRPDGERRAGLWWLRVYKGFRGRAPLSRRENLSDLRRHTTNPADGDSARTAEERSRHLSGDRALVTGGSRGIGKGIALALAEKGFAVAINALEADSEVENTLTELRALGAEVAVAIGDVSDLSCHEALLDEA